MPNYMFLLYGSREDAPNLSPDELHGVIRKYSDWRESLKRDGIYLASDKLKDDAGRVLRPGPNGPRLLDGPYSETKEVLGGYFAVRAASYERACELARTCPHLEFGGTIEVREIDQV